MNIVDPILFQCSRQPPAPAICVPGSGISLISYRRLERFVHNISRRLHGLGFPAGAVVALDLQDVIFHVAVMLALTRLGIATISMREGQDSLPVKINALITDSKIGHMPHAIYASLEWTEGDGLPLEEDILPQTKPHDLCRLILTSGTTRTPKAVGLSHELVAGRIARHLSVFGNRFVDCSRIYCDVPISSSLGFQFLIYTLWRGGTVFFPGKSFESTLPVLDQYKVQSIVGSPGGFENLLRCFDLVPAYQSNIDVLLCAGDVLSTTLSSRMRSRICSHLVTFYGSTEAGVSASAHAREILDMPRAVGFVTPDVEIEIVDPTGNEVSPDREGHVRIKSTYAVDRYFQDFSDSAQVFRDGWFYPGDLGRLETNGLLIITGREQLALNLGGDKINPETVELVLSQYNGVIEAAVFAGRTEYGNAEIWAAIVSKEPLEQQSLASYCSARIPRPFVPAKFYFVQSLPRNEMGKIDRKKLYELVSGTVRQAT